MNPGHYTRKIGDISVTALNDGLLSTTLDLVVDLPRDELEAYERSALRCQPPAITINAFLITNGRSRWLVDTGSGHLSGPGFGKIIDGLAAIGVSPDDIDGVLLTHMHGDHVNGLIGPEGTRRFGRAALYVHEDEIAFWQDDARVANAPPRSVGAVGVARQALGLYAQDLRPFEPGEVVPGVEAVPEPGHTPGHTGFSVASGGDRLLIWGDVVHLPAVQFPQPDAALVFDVDPDAARATRGRIMGRAADEGLLVAGMHLDFPAFGYVVRNGDGFRYVPDQWCPA